MIAPRLPRLAVIGTGVVGRGVMKAWSTRQYDVVGYDVDPITIERQAVDGYRAYHMSAFHACVADLVFICINTPQAVDGSIYLDYMLAGLSTIGTWLDRRVADGHYPMIVMRSTMLPNMSRDIIIPALGSASGRTASVDYGYAHLPEILRETDAVEDALNIWQVVIGELDRRTGDTLEKMFKPVLGIHHHQLLSRVPLEVAEAAKVLMNTFNATKISYYNMMGLLLETLGIDAQAAIDLSVRMGEGSLNPWYGTRTGLPYGGKCLPKDVAAVLAMSRNLSAGGQERMMTQLAATQTINHLMLELAQQGKAPLPSKGGFRRMSAKKMRLGAIGLGKTLHNTTALHDTREAIRIATVDA